MEYGEIVDVIVDTGMLHVNELALGSGRGGNDSEDGKRIFLYPSQFYSKGITELRGYIQF